ncbi:hypothetical protein TNIN_308431 [Trichonephila inaurata madagascariensis]|uniref:Uncharacterized protein n=1 Tax=Trichonephila inaurata madagascariensis TaxID=2747483 RepID=A0A8X6M667_9ARAC|nr:hypothetical protein TNIN_308431 [Trichonephila inaurata madagascariensis]
MANDQTITMESQNLSLPLSRASPPGLFTPCEHLIQVQNDIRKISLFAQGAQHSLNMLFPYMSANDLEVVDVFARHKYYKEQLQHTECDMVLFFLVQL